MDTAEDSPPAWEFMFNSPAMEVRGTVYAHLLAAGPHSLAADLFSIRGTIDYALLPATQAEPSGAEHVYQPSTPESAGRLRPCYTCGQMHWRKYCRLKARQQQQSASQSFTRGEPPARYYISKGGQCFDTQQRPTQHGV